MATKRTVSLKIKEAIQRDYSRNKGGMNKCINVLFSKKEQKKRAYLIIEGMLPTIHKNKKEAEHYVTFVRDTDKAHKKLKAMVCLFTEEDFKESFCNCKFEVI